LKILKLKLFYPNTMRDPDEFNYKVDFDALYKPLHLKQSAYENELLNK